MMYPEPDLAAVASLIADPTRAAILAALLGGEAMPATELAYRAGVTPQTASAHLAKLLQGNFVQVTVSGRHRYYALKDHEVAQTLETLQRLAPPSAAPVTRNARIALELCAARTCYDHLAGQLGVAVTEALIQHEYLLQDEDRYLLTAQGEQWLQTMHIDPTALRRERRKFAYPCLDWSERRFHLAGSLGAAIARICFEKSWIKRLPHTRAVQLTPPGEATLQQLLGIAVQG